ncbi:MAG TPA: hypothetical protein VLA93_21255 [Pyrinomonadaceae bacterium]|nr:hypothetical protein [Pyrinomonadaceae bacterium]
MGRLIKVGKQMKNKTLKILFLSLLLVIGGSLHSAIASDQSDVRDAVQRVFEQLKSRDYGALYDVLPSTQRSRMSRERFVNALQRAQDLYVLDKMDVGAIKIGGNLAVVDTVLYGRVVNPIQAEGKIVVQQYLVREDGTWRVATGDQATVKRFIASSPGFKKGFKLTPPRIYVKQEGRWIEFRPPTNRARST